MKLPCCNRNIKKLVYEAYFVFTYWIVMIESGGSLIRFYVITAKFSVTTPTTPTKCGSITY